jgi:hypothetical protein
LCLLPAEATGTGGGVELNFRFENTEDGFSLYSAPATPPGPACVCFLRLPAVGTPPATLSLPEAWHDPGVFIFWQGPPAPTTQQLVEALTPYENTRGVAWIAADRLRTTFIPLNYVSPQTGQVGSANGKLPFGNVELFLPSMTGMALVEDPPQFIFTQNGITLQQDDGQGYSLAPDSGQVSLSFDPASLGGFSFTAHWDPYNLFGLFADDPQSEGRQGGELRYFYEDAGAPQGVRQQRYPVLPALAPDWPPYLAFACEMAPLAPLDGTRTRFIFQDQDLGKLAAAVGYTVSGGPVTLTPSLTALGARAGLYPAARPGADGATAAYLAPLGPFELGVPGGAAKMMCGTAGTEYLQVAHGDILEFVPSRAAHSATFGIDAAARAARLAATPATADAEPLDDTCTTSWVRLHPAGGANALRGYYAQPGASVSFSRGTLGRPMNYPAAVSSLIALLTPDAGNASVFPLVPYGGVFALADGTAQDARALASFEKQVLAPVRGSQIRGATPAQPVFATEAGMPLPGTRTSTPQGLLVQLNDAPSSFRLTSGAQAPAAGTWQSVVLARSGANYLSFDADAATGVVDARLASALMREQLFMVLNNWARFPDITRLLTVAGFNFEIAPDPGDPDARSTVLVFKYASTLSLVDLIHTPQQWAEADYFVGDGKDQRDVRDTLAAALEIANAAQKDRDDPFGDFRGLANDPGWTGMIAFNAPINGNGMPADLQMLFAGIDGQLKAHHFGVQINRIRDSVDASPVPEISESSMFGVIYHGHGEPADTPVSAPAPRDGAKPDYAFTVYELAVAMKNSAVTQFHCRVGMTIDKLFGREVRLVGARKRGDIAANTVMVTGQYQRHGDVGTVVFNAAESGQFLFNPDGDRVRVLASFSLTGASLVPVASQDAKAARQAGTTVRSRFTLEGALAFAADPFPGVKGLDLFSYGTQSAGQAAGVDLSGLAFAISCELDQNGTRVGSPQIVPELSGLRAAGNVEAQRKDALVSMLPLKLSAIMHNEQGLDAKALGAMPVHVPELMGVTVSAQDAPGSEPRSNRASYVTSKPVYALQFALPLGSLGALADAHASLDASLVVAWGPSTFTPDDDGAALFVQLPQVTAGAFGFSLQGLLKTTFGDANLGLVQTGKGPAYVLLFNNVALSALGVTLPPKVITDFILFAAPGNPGAGNIGWSLAATQTSP